MNEAEARAWFEVRFDPLRVATLGHFLDLVVHENARQNLVAASTLPSIWYRHALDSAQLLALAGEHAGIWIDIGTGGGFPGLVVAILRDGPTILVEPRQKRASFLQSAVDALGVKQVQVEQRRVETVPVAAASVISARAVAALPILFENAAHLADQNTLWLLPKGRSARSEVEAAHGSWQGSFHVEHSLTDPESLIVVARGVAAA